MLARAYLPDEDGHRAAAELLENDEMLSVTGTRTRIEVSGALVRAAPAGRGADDLLAVLDGDLGPDGPVTVLAAPHDDIEEQALTLVRTYRLPAIDAWHVAAALLIRAGLAPSDEPVAFASRDEEQAAVATKLGFARWPGRGGNV